MCKKGSSELTNKAKAFLHGKELQDLINVPEESFIRFVIAMDIARYHFHRQKLVSKVPGVH
jgi:hypothetical protein